MSKQARGLLRPPRNAKRLQTPRTRLLTRALFSHLPKHEPSRPVSSGFRSLSAKSEITLAEFLPSSNDPIDGPRGRGAPSCGGGAEVYRLPEHTDDISVY